MVAIILCYSFLYSELFGFFSIPFVFEFHRNILVLMESAVSGHQYTTIRERLGEKLEQIRFDPYSKCKFQQNLFLIFI